MDGPVEPPRVRAALVIIGVVLVLAVLQVLYLFRYGSSADLDHASERISDPLTGPNAP